MSSDSTNDGRRRDALRLVHHHPGRLRVRAEAFRGAAPKLASVRARLDATPGVVSIDHAPLTGSILVTYQVGMIEPDLLIAQVADAADLDLPRKEAVDPDRPGRAIVEAVREVDEAIEQMSGSRLSLKTLVPAAVAAVGVYSWFEHPDRRLPRWDNLIYWSYSIFSNLHRHEIDEAHQRTRDERAARAAEEGKP